MHVSYSCTNSEREGVLPGIVLVKVLWKAIASLLNRRITAAISLHDMLHGFRAGQGTETAALEANLLQHLTATREAVLFEVSLDLRRPITPYTGRGPWTLSQCTGLVAGLFDFFEHTGTDRPWWPKLVGTSGT